VRQRSQHGANNEAVLFPNEDKQSERSPDFKGQGKIDSQHYWVSAWKKTSRDGTKKYLSLSFKPKQAKDIKGAVQQAAQDNDLNDDIPW